MSRKCDICGRGSTRDASRSHSNIKTAKRQHLNLQSKTVAGARLMVCIKCLKTMKKN